MQLLFSFIDTANVSTFTQADLSYIKYISINLEVRFCPLYPSGHPWTHSYTSQKFPHSLQLSPPSPQICVKVTWQEYMHMMLNGDQTTTKR